MSERTPTPPRLAPAHAAADARSAHLVIGELADRTGTSPETIRYYERVGVLPAPVRAGGGRYRRYGAGDVERLLFVRRARELGFSLDEVRELLGLADQPDRSCAEVDQLARAHLTSVDEKLARLGALRDELERVVGACRGGLPVAECRILGALSGALRGSGTRPSPRVSPAPPPDCPPHDAPDRPHPGAVGAQERAGSRSAASTRSRAASSTSVGR